MVRPGDRLGERYVVVEQIAAGGMGTLWRAHHVELDVDVALKVVSARASTPASLKRFKREAQAAARLRSPNIVQVLDYGEFDGQPYLAMELLKGEDLASRIAGAKKLRFDECAKILDGMARAVQLAHDAGIIHRDLKPANVFIEKVGDDEIVKILDFGIAKDLGAVPDPSSTTGAGVVGSPAYMSPEQVWARKVGFRADVWAMGVVAFEMLTGKNPFFDDTLAKIFERIIREPLPKIRDYEPGLPETLDVFFERALARAATDRIATPKELSESFRAAIEGRELPPMPRFDPNATTAQSLPAPGAAITVRRRDRGASGARGRVVWILAGIALVAFVVLLVASKSAPRADARAPEPTPVAPVEVAPPQPVSPPEPSAEPAASTVRPPEARAPAPTVRPRATKPVGLEKSSSAPTAEPAPPSSARDPKFGIPVSP
jgi:serine/threonine-protein kinase